MELGVPEGYVPEYAHGVAAYQREEYSQAEQHFAMAAQSADSEPYDCDIRVNWALSICYQIDFEHLDDQSREQAISRLLEASSILCENGCAVWAREGEWHDDEAQQLEDDIEKMLNSLQQPQSEDDQQQQPPPPKESEEEKQQRQQKQQDIERQRSQAMAASQDERQSWEQLHGDSGAGGKSW
jgi:hypothetical protein